MPTLVSESDKVERKLWTATDFLEWLKPGVHADLIDGEKFMHSPVNFRHARLLNYLHHLMDLYVQHMQIGEVHREVVAVRLSTRNVFLPDLSYFTPEQVGRLAESHAPFAPALVVEALSPWSADRDVGPKFAAYEEHGVQEYWILDPDTRAHRFYHRQGEELVEFAAGEALIRAHAIPGFWVRREWLNADPLPEVTPCLEELLAAGA
jgi:Uma2 family endonuclease